MRGFVVGSLALIVLYVVVQPGSASKLSTGSNVLSSSFARLLSPDAAGVPQRKTKTATTASPSAATPAPPSTQPIITV